MRGLLGCAAAFGIALGGLIYWLNQHSFSSWTTILRPVGSNSYQMVTGDGCEDDRQRWDKLFDISQYVFGKDPAPYLQNHVDWLPHGRVLDIAMGEGRNAVFLAKRGFQVEGVDLSEVAVRKAKRLAHENRVSITTTIADLNRYKIKPEHYQVILNFDYLQRNLISQMKKGLKKNGIIVFENYTMEQIGNHQGQYLRRDYLLRKGELKELFKEFEILHYEEINDGTFAKAKLIARKPR